MDRRFFLSNALVRRGSWNRRSRRPRRRRLRSDVHRRLQVRPAARRRRLGIGPRPSAALYDRRADPLLHHLRRLLPLEVPLDPLDDVGFDGAHVIAHVANTHGLEERDQRLLVHVELLGDLVDPDFAHAPRSTLTNPLHPSARATRCGHSVHRRGASGRTGHRHRAPDRAAFPGAPRNCKKPTGPTL